MHPELLLKALVGMTKSVSPREFSLKTGIINKTLVWDVLDYLVTNGIGTHSRSRITFCESDRIKTAILALKLGCDIESVSRMITWKDFELLTSEVFYALGFNVWKDVRFTNPRTQIDVIGVNTNIAIAVDCKHWRRNNLTSIAAFARRQAERTELLVRRSSDLSFGIPIIVTLHSIEVQFIDRIPIVPISKFRSFVEDFRSHLVEIFVAYRK